MSVDIASGGDLSGKASLMAHSRRLNREVVLLGKFQAMKGPDGEWRGLTRAVRSTEMDVWEKKGMTPRERVWKTVNHQVPHRFENPLPLVARLCQKLNDPRG